MNWGQTNITLNKEQVNTGFFAHNPVDEILFGVSHELTVRECAANKV